MLAQQMANDNGSNSSVMSRETVVRRLKAATEGGD
jgi:hypothetical protein